VQFARKDRQILFGDNGGADDPLGEVVYDWDLATDEIRWGPNLKDLTGLDVKRLATGLGYAQHLAPESPVSRYEAIMSTTTRDGGDGVSYSAVYGLVPSRRSSSPPVWIEDRGRWFADAKDRPGHAHGVIRVITNRFEAERARRAMERNPLVGSFGRPEFAEQISRHLNMSGRRPASFAVLLVDIDVAGLPDAAVALAAAVDRLRERMRTHEACARHAETSFAILLEDCSEEQAAAAAARFLAAIEAAPPGGPAPRARIGAVLAPTHGRTPQTLLRCAEEALEAARRAPNTPYVMHQPGASRPMDERRAPRQDDVLSALNEGRVLLALQPVVDAKARKVVFHEALVRIRREDGTLVMPQALVQAAERDGIVALLDRRVLDLAFAMLTTDRKLTLSINASTASLADTVWSDHLRTASKLRPDAARRLIIEIAENSVIADPAQMQAMLAEIKPLGVRIALDDFGAGHSSFKMLRGLPIDFLKIDGAFAQNLTASPDDRVFIRTLIDLARNLRIPTVAEWVEDEATARQLADWGVDFLQGHLFGRAVLPVEPGAHRAAS
jgi:EAL domain-containing protein (putative c-di-GMP-specific phosphodiesterase class I)/GGDEF domain-containing protein